MKALIAVLVGAMFLLVGWIAAGDGWTVEAQTQPTSCHYEIVGVSGTAAFLLNPCTGDSWYYASGVSYDGPNEPATWKRIVKE